MSDVTKKLPVKIEAKSEHAPAVQGWTPFESLHREVERLFDAFDGGFWSSPFRRRLFAVEPFRHREIGWPSVPAVDVSETDKAYEITVELPGMDEKEIEVKLSNGELRIKGEKREEKQEKKKDYYIHERQFGSFERWFAVPEGIDTDKIEANFKKGVLHVTLPKTPEAMKAEKKIEVKTAA